MAVALQAHLEMRLMQGVKGRKIGAVARMEELSQWVAALLQRPPCLENAEARVRDGGAANEEVRKVGRAALERRQPWSS